MEGFRELYSNMVPKTHDSENNTPLNITPLTHVSDGLYIECLPRVFCRFRRAALRWAAVSFGVLHRCRQWCTLRQHINSQQRLWWQHLR
jgi:hypothetical protein